MPPPPSTLQWGAYVGDTPASLTTFETLVGKSANIQGVFVGWGSGNSFPSEFKASLADKGKTLLIYWEQYGTTLDSIIAGGSDAYITQFAAAAKTYGGPIILAPFHEMNGNWDPWDGTVGNNTPAKVISAWRHVHDMFAGVTNVKFAWEVNNDSVPDTAANAIGVYYPGDAYVDYVAVDGFNFNDPWETFGQIFDTALTQLASYNKPMYLFSMACAAGTQKAAWITDAFTVQIQKYPLLAGWVWFNENKEEDWRVNSDANSLTAFKAALP
jgi:beta-mannanase